VVRYDADHPGAAAAASAGSALPKDAAYQRAIGAGHSRTMPRWIYTQWLSAAARTSIAS
jgi:hypothetical protein